MMVYAWAVSLLLLQTAPSSVVGLNMAVELARTHHPHVRQAQAAALNAQAVADQAMASLLPQLAVTAGYQRTTANFAARPGMLPSALARATASNSFAMFDFFTANVTAEQLLYDFGQTPQRWRAAQSGTAAQQQSSQATLLGVLAAVRKSFFAARAAKALVLVAQETLANHARHLRQTEAFVQVGTRPAIDLAQVRADHASAQVQRITSDNAYAAARVRLNQAMGIESSAAYDVADDTLEAVAGEEEDAQALLEEALSHRPELAALVQQTRAQQLRLKATQQSYWPRLAVTGGLTEQGPQLGSLAWNVYAGVQLSGHIFQGGLTRAQIAAERATLTQLSAQQEALRQQVHVELETARLAVGAAKTALTAAQAALGYAEQRLELAEARYSTGIGNAIELGDAQLARTSAAAARVQADYDLASARADLLYALGRI